MSDEKKHTMNNNLDNEIPSISGQLMFKAIMDHSVDSIYFKDKDFRFICVNKNKAIRHGFKSPNEMNGKTDFDFISRENAKIILKAEKSILEKGQPIIGQIEKLTRLDGTTTWASSSKYPLYGETAEIIGIWGISRDITEYESAKEALNASEVRYRAMIANIADVIAIIDPDGIIQYKSPNVNQSFGWLPKDLVGRDMRTLIHPDDLERIQTEFYSLMEKDESLKVVEFRHKCNDGSYKNIELTAINLVHDNNIKGVLVNYHDITERIKREEKLNYLGYHDVLTGLYNRSYFEREMKRLDIDRQPPLSVIVGDINGLKLINDSFGHDIGDKTIVEVANIIKSSCGQEDIIARTGGDEFCILLPNSGEETAQRICKRIYRKCEQYKNRNTDGVLFISISLGYMNRTIAHESIEAVMREAEAAMYRHKLLETRSLRSSVVSSIISTLQDRYTETGAHSERMKKLCRATGIALNMSDSMLDDLELLATLHDIGKISISDEIINKKSRLTDDEMEEMKRHTEIGYNITQSTIEFQRISEYILAHHERWDGNGYPRKFKGEEIPLLSRIIAVVDSYDAMTNDRPYRKACSQEYAVNEIKACSGTQFDPKIAKIFIEKVLGKNGTH